MGSLEGTLLVETDYSVISTEAAECSRWRTRHCDVCCKDFTAL